MYLSAQVPLLSAHAGSAVLAANGTFPTPSPEPDDPGSELRNWSSLIGIVTAIVGNVLIALALNVQRYAHIRLHRQRAEIRERAKLAMKHALRNNGAQQQQQRQQKGSLPARGQGYGTLEQDSQGNGAEDDGLDRTEREEAAEAHEDDPLAQSVQTVDSRWSEDCDGSKVASTYLKSPYWWLGQVLITVGEMGNFLAYGFAPASIVSPLGVVALVSNCVIAPILFKEVFRRRDFFGVVIAIGGAVTVVLSANQQETKLEPHDVWKAITTMEFEIYVGISCSLILVLMWASPRYGNRTILIDLGLVGLFGGYTALSTKGVSSMLSATLFRAFTTPVTYGLVLVLLTTAVMQVRYLNKALQRFDSTQVIPIQFVIFTLSVIIGSAVLYRDFERTTAQQAAKFVGGCLLTFFGVFLITSGRPSSDEEEEGLSEDEDVEETIGLHDHSPATPQSPVQHNSRRGTDASMSRSRQSSRGGFFDSLNKPFAELAGIDSRVAATRQNVAPASTSRLSLVPDPDSNGPSPLLDNPWRDPAGQSPQHPGMPPHALSTDSVVTFSGPSSGYLSEAPTPATPQHLSTSPIPPYPLVTGPVAEQSPVSTPRPSFTSASRPHSHHFSGPLISPSPLSSTVSAVVADKIRGFGDNILSTRRLVRRSRPGIRSSLFVPQDEVSDNEENASGQSGRREPTAGADGSRDATSDGELEGQQDKTAFGGRARSLSHTLGLGGLFSGSKRPRRNTHPENDGREEPRETPPATDQAE